MHGRLKVKTDEQKKAERDKENLEKLQRYQNARSSVFDLRSTLDDKLMSLTTQLLLFNSECSTFWNIRKEYLVKTLETFKEKEERDTFMVNELNFTVTCLKRNPKAYAVWFYREFVMNICGDSRDWDNELKLCDEFLKADERNFHCWDYRRVILKHLPNRSEEKEFEFTTSKIAHNFSNFSSWHYRSKLLCKKSLFADCYQLGSDVVKKEVDMIFNALFTDPSDQSAWFYYRWLHGPLECANVNIVTAYVLRKFSLVGVVFSKPISRSKLENSTMLICSSGVRITFRPIKPYGDVSEYWLFSVISSSMSPFGTIEVKISFPDIKCEAQFSFSEGENLIIQRNMDVQRAQLVPGMRTACPGVYASSNEMLYELAKEEPDNKLVLYYLCQLQRLSLTKESKQDFKKTISKLISVDPLRRGYYNDLQSSFVIEHLAKSSDINLAQVNLSNQALTHIRNITALCTIKSLDISGNNLTSLTGLEGFLALKKCCFDDNNISDLTPLENCMSLSDLSCGNNAIATVDSFSCLSDCHLLLTLSVGGNPVSQKNNLKEALLGFLPRLEHISM